MGRVALFTNTTGNFNTATGVQALQKNTEGGVNTATGVNVEQLEAQLKGQVARIEHVSAKIEATTSAPQLAANRTSR